MEAHSESRAARLNGFHSEWVLGFCSPYSDFPALIRSIEGCLANPHRSLSFSKTAQSKRRALFQTHSGIGLNVVRFTRKAQPAMQTLPVCSL